MCIANIVTNIDPVDIADTCNIASMIVQNRWFINFEILNLME